MHLYARPPAADVCQTAVQPSFTFSVGALQALQFALVEHSA